MSKEVNLDQEEERLRKEFRVLHDPTRPVFHFGHARRGNKAEDYDSKKILETGAHLLEQSIKAAHGIIENFGKHAKKNP